VQTSSFEFSKGELSWGGDALHKKEAWIFNGVSTIDFGEVNCELFATTKLQ
jgi:hypothetical protein